MENTDVKTIGVEYLAYEAAKKIPLPDILASIIGRLIAPGSEVSRPIT